MLQAEREKVEGSVAELRAYHAPRRVSMQSVRISSRRGSNASNASDTYRVGSVDSAGGGPADRVLRAELRAEQERCAQLEQKLKLQQGAQSTSKAAKSAPADASKSSACVLL